MTLPFWTSTLCGGCANLHSWSGREHLFRWYSRQTSSCNQRESLTLANVLTIAIISTDDLIEIECMWQSRQSWRDLNDSAEKSRTAKKTTDDNTHASVNGQYCNWFETLYLTHSHLMRRTFRTRTAFIFLSSKHLCHFFKDMNRSHITITNTIINEFWVPLLSNGQRIRFSL